MRRRGARHVLVRDITRVLPVLLLHSSSDYREHKSITKHQHVFGFAATIKLKILLLLLLPFLSVSSHVLFIFYCLQISVVYIHTVSNDDCYRNSNNHILTSQSIYSGVFQNSTEVVISSPHLLIVVVGVRLYIFVSHAGVFSHDVESHILVNLFLCLVFESFECMQVEGKLPAEAIVV